MEKRQKTIVEREREIRLGAQALYQKCVSKKPPELYPMTKLPLPSWLVGTFVLDKGERYTFNGYEALYPIAADTYPFKCILKPSQCGATVLAMGEMFYNAAKGLSTIYYLPTQQAVGPYVKGRVFECMHRNDYIKSLMRGGRKDWAQECLVFLTGAKVYHLGLVGRMGKFNIPADRVVIDELDRVSDMNDVALARRRLGERLDIGISQFCTPTIPMFGIDELYTTKSDRRAWQVRCPHCGKWTELKWVGGVVEQIGERNWELRDTGWSEDDRRDVYIYCMHSDCRKPVDRLHGEFVAELENQPYHGYSLSRLFMTSHSIKSIWQDFCQSYSNSGLMQIFYNHSMGLPYIVTGSELALDDIHKNINGANFYSGSSCKDGTLNCVLGIDVNPSIGNHFVVIDISSKRVVELGVKRWGELSELWSCYNICTTIIDRYPEVAKATELQKEHKGVYLAEYKDLGGLECNIKQVVSSTDTGLDEIVNCVQIDRTVSLDGLFADIRNVDIKLPVDILELGGKASGKAYCKFADELMSMVRSYQETGAGGHFTDGEIDPKDNLKKKVFAVYRSRRDDHMAHAANYARQALGLIQNIPPIPQWRGVKEHRNESDVPDFLGEGW